MQRFVHLFVACTLVIGLSEGWSGGQITKELPRRDEKIAWGKPFRGVQSGVSFQGSAARFRTDATVTLNLYWRNTTKEPITLSYATYPGSEFRPTVMNQSGQRMPMDVELVTAFEATKTLEPGQTVFVAHPTMVFAAQHNTGVDGLLPQYRLAPGRYRVKVAGNEKDSIVPVSGSLEFEIVNK